MVVDFAGVTGTNNATRITKPANCLATAGGNTEIGEIAPVNQDFSGSMTYTCAYANRTVVPSSLTFTVLTNITGAWRGCSAAECLV